MRDNSRVATELNRADRLVYAAKKQDRKASCQDENLLIFYELISKTEYWHFQ